MTTAQFVHHKLESRFFCRGGSEKSPDSVEPSAKKSSNDDSTNGGTENFTVDNEEVVGVVEDTTVDNVSNDNDQDLGDVENDSDEEIGNEAGEIGNLAHQGFYFNFNALP